MNNFYRGNQVSGGQARSSGTGVRSGQERTSVSTPSPRSTQGVTFSSPPRQMVATPGLVVDERLAHITDEGQNSSNAQQLNDHVFQGTAIEELIDSVVRAEESAAEKEAQK